MLDPLHTQGGRNRDAAQNALTSTKGGVVYHNIGQLSNTMRRVLAMKDKMIARKTAATERRAHMEKVRAAAVKERASKNTAARAQRGLDGEDEGRVSVDFAMARRKRDAQRRFERHGAAKAAAANGDKGDRDERSVQSMSADQFEAALVRRPGESWRKYRDRTYKMTYERTVAMKVKQQQTPETAEKKRLRRFMHDIKHKDAEQHAVLVVMKEIKALHEKVKGVQKQLRKAHRKKKEDAGTSKRVLMELRMALERKEQELARLKKSQRDFSSETAASQAAFGERVDAPLVVGHELKGSLDAMVKKDEWKRAVAEAREKRQEKERRGAADVYRTASLETLLDMGNDANSDDGEHESSGEGGGSDGYGGANGREQTVQERMAASMAAHRDRVVAAYRTAKAASHGHDLNPLLGNGEPEDSGGRHVRSLLEAEGESMVRKATRSGRRG